MTDHSTEKDARVMPTFPCCRHCVPEPDTGKCWADDVGGHGCSCLDCPPNFPPAEERR